MSSPSTPCVAVTGAIDDFGTERPEKYSACDALPLRRFWDGPDALPEEGGRAYVGAAEEGLSFYVLFEDSDIFSTATADNQRLWALGDVAEIFVKPGVGLPGYWEIHIAPNNYMMDIYIPGREKMTTGNITWDDVIAADSHADKRVEVLEGKWAIEICVPWQAFGLEAAPAAGTVWQFAVSRYNYSDGLGAPEHSTTAHLSELNFHRYEEFTDLVF